MIASELLVKCLEEEKVECVFGVPGEENIDLMESIRTSEKIKFILARDEQAASFMAATYGRLTGKAGVVLATLGPGALNLVNGVAFAHLTEIPMVVLTAQNGVRENVKENDFQYVNIVEMFKEITKWNKSVSASKWLAKSVRQAFKIAESDKPGPTHLELPEDVMKEKVDGMPLRKEEILPSFPNEDAVLRAVELMKTAKRPLILVASGANHGDVFTHIELFVRKTGLYAVHTQMGKGVLSDKDPQSLYAIGIHARDWAHCGLEYADLIITIGYHIGEYIPRVWNPDNKKKIIHVDFTQSKVDNYYNPDVEVLGDVSKSLDAIAEKLEGFSWNVEYYSKVRSFLDAQFEVDLKDESVPVKPQRLVSDLRSVMRDSDIVVHDNGMHKIWAARLYPVYAPKTFLVDNALASMGGGLPGGIAAKLVHPDKRVVVVTGDGGFMMNSQELETAVRLKLNVVVVIWNDNGFGMVKWHQEREGKKPFGVDFGNPDFVKYAESYGALGLRVTNASDFKKMLEKAFKFPGPVVIEAPVDYSENVLLSKKIQNLVCPLP